MDERAYVSGVALVAHQGIGIASFVRTHLHSTSARIAPGTYVYAHSINKHTSSIKGVKRVSAISPQYGLVSSRCDGQWIEGPCGGGYDAQATTGPEQRAWTVMAIMPARSVSRGASERGRGGRNSIFEDAFFALFVVGHICR